MWNFPHFFSFFDGFPKKYFSFTVESDGQLCSISLKEIQIYFPIRSENRLSIELWVELVEDLCFKDWMRVDDSG